MTSGLLQPGHLLILLIVVLVVFGPKRLPQLGRSLGEGVRSLRSGFDSQLDADKPAASTPRGDDPAAPA